MQRFTLFLLVAALLGVAVNVQADLNGTTVTGSLLFQYDSTNYFDPANGYVPGGYGNVSDFTVTIDPNTPTFGFNDGANLNVAAFAGATLTITDTNACCGAGPWTMTFTDPGFGFYSSFNKTSDTFSNGGLTSSFDTGTQTLTISWVGGDTSENWNYRAIFEAQSSICSPTANCSVTPDPSSWMLLASGGMVGLGALSRRVWLFSSRESGNEESGKETL